MSIGSAMERGSAAYVYDEKGHLLFSKPGKLIGYTASTVSIPRVKAIYTYDPRGRQVFAKSV